MMAYSSTEDSKYCTSTTTPFHNPVKQNKMEVSLKPNTQFWSVIK